MPTALAASVKDRGNSGTATAEQNGDGAGLEEAEAAVKEAGEQVDQLDLFRKNLQSFVHLCDFLSQIIPYEDRELE